MILIKNLHDLSVRDFSDFDDLFSGLKKTLFTIYSKIFILTGAMTYLIEEKSELIKQFDGNSEREKDLFLAGLEMQTASYLAIYLKKKGISVKTLCGFEIELCKNDREEGFSINQEVFHKKIGNHKMIIIPGPHPINNTNDLCLLHTSELKDFEIFLEKQFENL